MAHEIYMDVIHMMTRMTFDILKMTCVTRVIRC